MFISFLFENIAKTRASKSQAVSFAVSGFIYIYIYIYISYVSIRGFDYNFANYTFKTRLESKFIWTEQYKNDGTKKKLEFSRRWRWFFLNKNKVFSEIIVGVIIVRSPYEICGFPWYADFPADPVIRSTETPPRKSQGQRSTEVALGRGALSFSGPRERCPEF